MTSSSFNLQMTKPGVAVITGASSGIGRATAIALSEAGWTCVLSGRREVELKETANLIEKASEGKGKTLIVPGDLTQTGAAEKVFESAFQTFGRIDLLFNNAGIAQPNGPIDEIDFEAFKTLLHINVSVPFECTSLAFKYMKKQSPQGGRIINNGSISSMSPRPNSAPYTLSKHAITGLTKSTSLDGRKYRIACTQIDIGNAISSLSAAHGAGHAQADGSIKKEDMMNVGYAAQSVVYLASLPLEVNVLNQTIMATNMPFVGRG
ncbi:hypothetical protein L7F22_039400 [Adiantum nelumboides]|nr:hypothetical protein [Adiantum nelumboides]